MPEPVLVLWKNKFDIFAFLIKKLQAE